MAEKILRRTRGPGFGSQVVSHLQGSAGPIRLQDEVSPSQTYFPSHMSQTLNSLRRQSKHSYEKQASVFAQEE